MVEMFSSQNERGSLIAGFTEGLVYGHRDSDILKAAGQKLGFAYDQLCKLEVEVAEFSTALHGCRDCLRQLRDSDKVSESVHLMDKRIAFQGQMERAANSSVFLCESIRDLLNAVREELKKCQDFIPSLSGYKGLTGEKFLSPLHIIETKLPDLTPVRDGIAHSGEYLGDTERHAAEVECLGGAKVFLSSGFQGDCLILTYQRKGRDQPELFELPINASTVAVMREAVLQAGRWLDPMRAEIASKGC